MGWERSGSDPTTAGDFCGVKEEQICWRAGSINEIRQTVSAQGGVFWPRHH